jgi:hypothetical protein
MAVGNLIVCLVYIFLMGFSFLVDRYHYKISLPNTSYNSQLFLTIFLTILRAKLKLLIEINILYKAEEYQYPLIQLNFDSDK